MMLVTMATARAPTPKEKAYPVGAGQASTALLEKLGGNDDTLNIARKQRLRHLNISEPVLSLLAGLCWEVCDGRY